MFLNWKTTNLNHKFIAVFTKWWRIRSCSGKIALRDITIVVGKILKSWCFDVILISKIINFYILRKLKSWMTRNYARKK